MKHLTYPILITLCLLTFGYHSIAQKDDKASDHKAYKKGVKLFKNGNFVNAEEQFQLLLDSGFRYQDLIAYQAQVHLELHEPHAAKDVILLTDERNDDLDYLLAISHYHLEEFDDALRELNLVKDTATFDVHGFREIIENSMSHYQEYQGYIIQNCGPEVNTKYREYAAVMYDGFNELLFTSRNDSSEFTAHDGMAFETIHDTSIDSLNIWHVADPFEFHTGHEKKHDATVQVYQNGKKLITFHDGRLYKSHLVNNVWEEDGALDIHGFDGVDTHCHIADDESYIIFASDFHSLGHDLDLYVSYKQDNGSWSEPKGLEMLNTDSDEDSPFLASDSTLYFSSRGHNTLGGYDVFKSTYDKVRKRWSSPINLDYPINTVSEDIYFSIYGHVGFISSTRVGGHGSLDLYRIFTFNEILIKGQLIDEETNQPVPNAKIELEYEDLYFESFTNDKGAYEMFVPVNKDMLVTFSKDDEVLSKENYYADIFFREQNDRKYNFIIPKTAPSITDEPTLVHIEIMNSVDKDPYVASIAHDEVSHWSDSLSNHYEQQRIAHYNPKDIEAEPSVADVTDDAVSETGNVDTAVSEVANGIAENATESGSGLTKPLPSTVSVFYDFNSADPKVSGRATLKQLYDDILSVNDFIVEIDGHADSRGSYSYNKKLSHQRAEKAAEYLYSLGLNKDKVEVDSHGETKLLDQSDSESSHAKNRRVEINFR